MNIKICADYIPLKGTPESACYDLIAKSDPIIVGQGCGFDFYQSVDYIEYNTCIKLQPAKGYYVKVYPRSSISKYNLLLCNSVAIGDNDYRGDYKLRYKYIVQPSDLVYNERTKTFSCRINYSKVYNIGDKIAQITFCKMEGVDWEEDRRLEETLRKDGGFGSTGV
jgi:dUTPase